MKSDKEYLLHIRDEIFFLEETVSHLTFEEFYESPLFKHAIERSLEIIGEAVKKLSREFKESEETIEWKAIAGTRDKLIHEYMGVDYELVWDILKSKLPDLKIVVSRVLKTYE